MGNNIQMQSLSSQLLQQLELAAGANTAGADVSSGERLLQQQWQGLKSTPQHVLGQLLVSSTTALGTGEAEVSAGTGGPQGDSGRPVSVVISSDPQQQQQQLGHSKQSPHQPPVDTSSGVGSASMNPQQLLQRHLRQQQAQLLQLKQQQLQQAIMQLQLQQEALTKSVASLADASPNQQAAADQAGSGSDAGLLVSSAMQATGMGLNGQAMQHDSDLMQLQMLQSMQQDQQAQDGPLPDMADLPSSTGPGMPGHLQFLATGDLD
ncbi:hypothetical protein HaLaN_28644, partial [Haematococcus lacustris]